MHPNRRRFLEDRVMSFNRTCMGGSRAPIDLPGDGRGFSAFSEGQLLAWRANLRLLGDEEKYLATHRFGARY